MTKYISISKCKKRLAVTWFIGAGVIFFLILLQSIFGRYSERVADAWGWFLPTVMPTLSLMIGVLVADTLRVVKREKNVDPFMYKVALSLSVTYFLVVLVTIALQPFSSVPPLELLDMSNLWLAPLQGLVAAALGAFFVKLEHAE